MFRLPAARPRLIFSDNPVALPIRSATSFSAAALPFAASFSLAILSIRPLKPSVAFLAASPFSSSAASLSTLPSKVPISVLRPLISSAFLSPPPQPATIDRDSSMAITTIKNFFTILPPLQIHITGTYAQVSVIIFYHICKKNDNVSFIFLKYTNVPIVPF